MSRRGADLQAPRCWPCRVAGGFLLDLRRRWPLFALLAAAWIPVMFRVSGDGVPVLPIIFNITGSLPYTVAVVRGDSEALRRGDFIVYSFEGNTAAVRAPGLAHQPFFKRVAGLPGDPVEVRDRNVYVGGSWVGIAKTHTKAGVALDPIDSMTIPEGWVYAQGTTADSFDSRYKASGLVRQGSIAYRVRPLF